MLWAKHGLSEEDIIDIVSVRHLREYTLELKVEAVKQESRLG